jgi:nucleoid DNA-binding protein
MISLKDFYLHYPHKCVPNPNTVPSPYFPKTEMDCENKYSLSSSQWIEIIEVYLEELMKYLLKGNSFNMPLMLGTLNIVKTKAKEIRYMFTRSKDSCERRVEKNINKYKPILKWTRNYSTTKLPDPWIWKLTLLKESKFSHMLNKVFDKSPLIFNDAKKF